MADKTKGMTPSGVARRNGRKGIRRSRTLATRKLSPEEVAETEAIHQELAPLRPRFRGDCREAARPCPWVSCKFHLYLDVNPETGAIKINFPDLEVWEMPHTCALDIADRGGLTLEEVGEILNLTRERIRQVEAVGQEKLRLDFDDLGGAYDEE